MLVSVTPPTYTREEILTAHKFSSLFNKKVAQKNPSEFSFHLKSDTGRKN